MKKTIVSLFCFISFVFLFSAFSATEAAAERYRFYIKTVSTCDKVEIPIPFVAIKDVETGDFLGETDGDGVALISLDRKRANLQLSSLEIITRTIKVKYKKPVDEYGNCHVKAEVKFPGKKKSKRQVKKDIEKFKMEMEKKRQQNSSSL